MQRGTLIFVFLLLGAIPAAAAEPLRIGLFSLLRPEAIDVRVLGSGSAVLDAGANVSIDQGDLVRLRLGGKGFSVTVVDPYGRVRQSFIAREAQITPSGSTTFELSVPGRLNRPVRGQVVVSAPQEGARGQLRVVVRTDREAAVASIVAAEMSGLLSLEALKAVAITVRTFMLSHERRHDDEGFDFCDTTHCQLYRGQADLSDKATSSVIEGAVRHTEGKYLSYEGRPMESYYTAACGGLSATPEMVWGGATAGSYPHGRILCRWCRGSRYDKWQRSANAAAVLAALSAGRGVELSQAAEIHVEAERPSDFVRRVIVRDRGRRYVSSADEFRRLIGRRLGWNTVLSPSFVVERRGQAFIFRGRGFGSQVGLCVAGAAAQAAAGRGYLEILNYYYPQAEIK